MRGCGCSWRTNRTRNKNPNKSNQGTLVPSPPTYENHGSNTESSALLAIPFATFFGIAFAW